MGDRVPVGHAGLKAADFNRIRLGEWFTLSELPHKLVINQLAGENARQGHIFGFTDGCSSLDLVQ